jgi:hypothetical protein
MNRPSAIAAVFDLDQRLLHDGGRLDGSLLDPERPDVLVA